MANTSFLDRKEKLEVVNMFSQLDDEQKDALIDGLYQKTWEQGEVIITEGDTGDELFIVKSGFVRVTSGGIGLRTMKAGDYFGDQALLFDQTRTATVTATR
jgi:cGMP-dependent protein kinase